jgi:hypothetical protein
MSNEGHALKGASLTIEGNRHGVPGQGHRAVAFLPVTLGAWTLGIHEDRAVLHTDELAYVRYRLDVLVTRRFLRPFTAAEAGQYRDFAAREMRLLDALAALGTNGLRNAEFTMSTSLSNGGLP